MTVFAVDLPLRIYRLERFFVAADAMFELTKASFLVIFIIFVTFYNGFHSLLSLADLSIEFLFFCNTCYLHPDFFAKHVLLISQKCNEDAKLSAESNTVLQQTVNVWYNTWMFGYCKGIGRVTLSHQNGTLRINFRKGSTLAVCSYQLLATGLYKMHWRPAVMVAKQNWKSWASNTRPTRNVLRPEALYLLPQEHLLIFSNLYWLDGRFKLCALLRIFLCTTQ